MRNWSEYILVRVLVFLVGLFGLKLMYITGWIISGIIYRLDSSHRKLAFRQISQCFPEFDDAKVKDIARKSFDSAMLLGLEMFIANKYINKENLHDRVKILGLEEFSQYFRDAKNGVVTVTGHYGNWEMGGFTLGALGFPCVALARPLDNPLLNKYVNSTREVENNRIVNKKGGIKEAARALNEGKFVGFIGDQDAGRRGMFVDFFGQPASTFRSAALLAIKHEAPILVCSLKRIGRQLQFEFSIPRIITPDQWANQDEPVRWVTQEYTTAIENIIRREPEQYFGWLHHRWKHKPDGTRVK